MCMFQNNVTMSIMHNHAVVSNLVLDNIWVYGVGPQPSQVMKNGASHNNFTYNATSKVSKRRKKNSEHHIKFKGAV